MSSRRPHQLALRSAAVLGLAVALSGLTAPMSQALGLPQPVSTAVGQAVSAVKGAPAGLGLPAPATTGTGGSGTSTTSRQSTTASGTPKAGGSTATSSSGSSAGHPRGSTGSSSQARANGAVVDSPAATACLIPSGTSSPAVRVDLKAAGVDLSSPLVRQFPQALTRCPAGAIPAGVHVLSVDAAVKDLLGACVRVTRQVIPVQTTLVVLDRDLISELTKAGVPLQRLVVPCPRSAGAPGAGSRSTGSRSSAAADRTGAPSALPTGLAFTGSDSVPLALLGGGLLWLGVLLTRRTRASLRTDAGRG